VLGLLLHAKIHNDLEVLQNLESTIMELIGAREMGFSRITSQSKTKQRSSVY
jgi:hypothetical protein